jgi:hypothetical protein
MKNPQAAFPSREKKLREPEILKDFRWLPDLRCRFFSQCALGEESRSRRTGGQEQVVGMTGFVNMMYIGVLS